MAPCFDRPRFAVWCTACPMLVVFAVGCGDSFDALDALDAGDAAGRASMLDAGLRDGLSAADVTTGDPPPVEAGRADVSSEASTGEREASLGDAEARQGDAKPLDAKPLDAKPLDANPRDAPAGSDSSSIDAGERDGGRPKDAEAGLSEAGLVDAGGRDADATFDAADGGNAAGDAGSRLLGSASKFAVLAGQTITITPSPALTTITGDVGVSPGTAIATLPAGQPTGGSVHAGDPVALQAQSDLTVAYNTLVSRACSPANNRSSVDLGGKTLAPGVYCFASSAGITGDLVLDAQGAPGAEWIFQVGTTLTTATNATVSVIGGGSGCNVYWQIGSSATLGTGTKLVGNIVAHDSITLVTGSTVLVGRTLARTAAVNLDGNIVSAASCQ